MHKRKNCFLVLVSVRILFQFPCTAQVRTRSRVEMVDELPAWIHRRKTFPSPCLAPLYASVNDMRTIDRHVFLLSDTERSPLILSSRYGDFKLDRKGSFRIELGNKPIGEPVRVSSEQKQRSARLLVLRHPSSPLTIPIKLQTF